MEAEENGQGEAIARNLYETVSYTHLDVYKRQSNEFVRSCLEAVGIVIGTQWRTCMEADVYKRQVFHLRRILANALDIPKSMVRAEKPRIGGGFGAKQTAVCLSLIHI